MKPLAEARTVRQWSSRGIRLCGTAGTTRPYRYSNALRLLEDFWREVHAVLDDLGIER